MRSVILDGHNDLALAAWLGEPPRHVLLEQAQEADFAGCFFALGSLGDGEFTPPTAVPYDVRLADPVPFDVAFREASEMATALEGLDVTIVRAVEEIVSGRVNAIMHIEGAE